MKIKLFVLLTMSVNIVLAQSILSVSPNTAQSGGTSTTISVTSNNTFWNTGAGIYYVRLVNATDTVYGNITNLIDDTHLECTFFIQGSVPAGCYDVQTFDLVADLVTLTCAFTITPGGPSSSILSITPNTALAGGVVGPFDVVGYNTFWMTGAGLHYVRLVGYNDTINMFSTNSITDDTHASISFFVPNAAVNGCYEVQAYDLLAEQVILSCGFTISGGTGGTAAIENSDSQSKPCYIFPNPASNQVSIDVTGYSNVQLFLSDISGRVLINETYLEEAVVNLDLSDFESGVYLLRFESDGNVIGSQKLIIE
jgi:hypothetical protein